MNRKIIGREKFDEKNWKRVIKLMREWVWERVMREMEREWKERNLMREWNRVMKVWWDRKLKANVDERVKKESWRENERVWDDWGEARGNGKREFVREIGKQRVDEKENGNRTMMRESDES